jgi:hypothetical protein
MPKQTRKHRKQKSKSRKGGHADDYATNLKNCKNINISEAKCIHDAYKYDFPGLLRGIYTNPKKLSRDQSKQLLKQYYEKNKDELGPFDDRNFEAFYKSIPDVKTYNDVRGTGIHPY